MMPITLFMTEELKEASGLINSYAEIFSIESGEFLLCMFQKILT